jgi:AraC-like DNA-binding protein
MNDQRWEFVEPFVDRQINKSMLHVWPFREAFPIDVRFLILNRSQDVPLHRPDHLEVVLFQSGELAYEVEGNTSVIGKNDVLVVGNQFHHRCRSRSPSQPEARAVVLSFLPETVHSGFPVGDDVQYLMPFNLTRTMPNVIAGNVGLSDEIFGLIERIQQKMPATCERSQLAIRTYLKMILLTIVNYCSEIEDNRLDFSRKQEALERLIPIFEYLHQHYDERVRVNDAARLCAVSPCCFMNLFKEATGLSFVGYLNQYRVAKAKDLLSQTSKPISAIGIETGFCTQSYFGLIFRKITGMTPLDYRMHPDCTKFRSSFTPQ